jgi:hypothetical protein
VSTGDHDRDLQVLDAIAIAKLECLLNNTVATVTVDDSYAGTNVSGLAGLAWPALADGDSTPFWIPLAEQWEEQMFSFHLNRVAVTEEVYEEGVSSPGGTVTFG